MSQPERSHGAPGASGRHDVIEFGARLRERRAAAAGRLPPWWNRALAGLLIVIMILRPRGLLGEETREAG